MTKTKLLELARLASTKSDRETLALKLAGQELTRTQVKERRAALKTKYADIERLGQWAKAATYLVVALGLLALARAGEEHAFWSPATCAVAGALWVLGCWLLEFADTKTIAWCFLVPFAASVCVLVSPEILDFGGWRMETAIPHALAYFIFSNFACGSLWLIGTFFVALFSSAVVAGLMKHWDVRYEQELLVPIAGTQQCVTMVEFLEKSGDTVKAWRDLAIAEHEELLQVDWVICRALAAKVAADCSREERQAALDAACRVAHGVA